MSRAAIVLWLCVVPVLACGEEGRAGLVRFQPSGPELAASCAAAEQLGPARSNRVLNDRLTPNWLEDGSGFWWRRQLSGGESEFVRLGFETGKPEPAFDHEKLAVALAKAKGSKADAKRLPFDFIYFPKEKQEFLFAADGKTWRCALDSYEVTAADEKDLKKPAAAPAPQRRGGQAPPPEGPRFWTTEETKSPDKKQVAFLKDNNLHLKPADSGEAVALTKDGKAGAAFARFSWAPDGQALVALLERPQKDLEVYLVASTPPGQHRARLQTRGYAQPGDPMTTYEVWVIPLESKEAKKISVEPSDFGGMPRPRWRKDGQRFLYEKTDRGHQRYRLMEVDSRTGDVRNVIDEQTKTFVNQVTRYFRYIGDDAALYASERDGWNHLYWVGLKDGDLRLITKGDWRVRQVERMDEGKKQIWFTASGLDEKQDPYFIHHCRVNFDGSGFTRLTEGDGTHSVQWSPDRKWLIDTWSRVDQPPVHALRHGEDGKLVCKLDEANAAKLKEGGWKAPEVFVAKGRDGKTDIWGVVFWPPQFSPNKTFPVIENIYAGPQDSFVPKGFRTNFGEMEQLAQLGFIVVQIDGMGTSNRSKAFHDVCWHNLADAGLPDRILWLKALAAKHPQVDLDRVGIYGTSAGGQSSTGAVLFHPEFYKVAVSSCGCHDNRIDKMWWNEQWMGYPVGPHYAEQSNITNAGKLQGQLMLIVGELDTNVPPESTYRLADALIKARKDFELVVIPGANHTDGGPYGKRKRRDFFIKHLMNVEPPTRNGTSATATSGPGEKREGP